MTLKELGLNSERFLHKAFEETPRKKLLRSAYLRRNVYSALFFIGIVCIFVAAFIGRAGLSCLSLFLATLSLVVVTKYDTQIFFLQVIEEREKFKESDPGFEALGANFIRSSKITAHRYFSSGKPASS